MTPQLIELAKIAMFILIFAGLAVVIGYAARPLLLINDKSKPLPIGLIKSLYDKVNGDVYPGRMDDIRVITKRLWAISNKRIKGIGGV